MSKGRKIMLVGKCIAVTKIFGLRRFRFPTARFSVSPFSLWTIQAGWIASGTFVGLILTIKVIGFFLVRGEYTNPFIRYDAILPGNPVRAASAFNCFISETRINGALDMNRFSCTIFPQDGFFDIIHVEGNNSEITELSFYATNVSLGQLLLRWKPINRPELNGGSIQWNSGAYSIDVANRTVDYDANIRIFSFKGLPKS